MTDESTERLPAPPPEVLDTLRDAAEGAENEEQRSSFLRALELLSRPVGEGLVIQVPSGELIAAATPPVVSVKATGGISVQGVAIATSGAYGDVTVVPRAVPWSETVQSYVAVLGTLSENAEKLGKLILSALAIVVAIKQLRG